MGQFAVGFGYLGDAAASTDPQPYTIFPTAGFARAVPDYNGPPVVHAPYSDLVGCWWPQQQWTGSVWLWNASFEAW